jgi:hypothetical protein
LAFSFSFAEVAMNRPLTVLTRLALVMAIGECISAVVITIENYAGSVPEFAVLFAALFFVGAWLLHRGRAAGGAALVGFLAIFEIVSSPSWQKHNAYDWVSDSVYVVLSAVTLAFAIAVLVSHRRSRPVRT